MPRSSDFSIIIKKLKKLEMITVPAKTRELETIDVWASKIQKGKRKGQEVIRTSWGQTSTFIDDYKWENPKNKFERVLKELIIREIIKKEKMP